MQLTCRLTKFTTLYLSAELGDTGTADDGNTWMICVLTKNGQGLTHNYIQTRSFRLKNYIRPTNYDLAYMSKDSSSYMSQ